MANFEYAFDITMNFEGGYSNDQTDKGGETYKGVARNFWPLWPGWPIIDMLKIVKNFPQCLGNNDVIQNHVRVFYKEKFWDVLNLDLCKSQLVSEKLFDIGVNMGSNRAGIFFQKSLNYLNRNGSLFSDLKVDGLVGKKTYFAFDILYDNGDEKFVYKIINILQGMHYLEFMDKSPEQEKFTRGWLKRVNFI